MKEEWDLGGTAFQTKAQGQASDPGILRQERRGRRDPCQETGQRNGSRGDPGRRGVTKESQQAG